MDFTKIKHLNFKVFLVLGLLLILAYSSSFKGDWVLDDDQNILTNQKLHITDLSFTSLKGALYANPYDSGSLYGESASTPYRPLPCLTFALNWYAGQDNPFGYHVVNFVIHWLTAFFLFAAVKLLLQTPRFNNALSRRQIYGVAFFAALLWALHPIQIQAVTYIVQRMTSMMAMFYILGIVCFLYGKLHTGKKRITAYLGCFVCFICSLLSKENAGTFPLALLLIHWIFFAAGGFGQKHKALRISLTVIVVIAVLATVAWLMQSSFLLAFYNIHDYGPLERLLTQTRILCLYISQIFVPLPGRFQIDHYISVSASLFNPGSTLPATALILVLLIGAFFKAKRWPLLSFAILFFFAGHLFESTIWPLDLVFEHRNYLPTMFVAPPIVYGVMRFFNRCETKHAGWGKGIIVVAALIIVMLGASTFLRNGVWQNEANLYWAAIQRNPKVTRSNINYGVYLVRQGQAAQALPYFEQAIASGEFSRPDEKADAHFNLANAYLGMEDYERAIAKMQENIKNYPENIFYKEYLARLYRLNGAPHNALEIYTDLLRDNPDNLSLNLAAGDLWYESDGPVKALPCLLKACEIIELNNMQGRTEFTALYQKTGIACIAAQEYAKARRFLYRALNQRTAQDSVYVILWITGLDCLENQTTDERLADFMRSEAAQPFIAENIDKITALPYTPPEIKNCLQNYPKTNP